MFEPRRPLWNLGFVLWAGGATGMFALAILANIINPDTEGWIQGVGIGVTLAFFVGAAIWFGYAVRYYLRIQFELNVEWNYRYLFALLFLHWLSPFYFIAKEGREAFFGNRSGPDEDSPR